MWPRGAPSVLIVERRLPNYRLAFFDGLRDELWRSGIRLSLSCGQPSVRELSKKDEGTLEWACSAPVSYLGPLAWQPFDPSGHDLVIVGHENKLLFNHWLCRPWRPYLLGFFGHGADFAAPLDRFGPREWLKQVTARQADWWFAYTESSRQRLQLCGVLPDRITVFNNSIDTDALSQAIDRLTDSERRELSQQLGLTPGKTALFLGSLNREKNLPLLIEAASRCARRDERFRLLVVGDGDQMPLLQSELRRHGRWLQVLGASHGLQRARWLAVSDMLLLPQSVGLAILDGFAAGLPLLTTKALGHGPEIAYLEPGFNGEMTTADADHYATGLQRWLDEPDLLARLRDGARESARHYSIDAMVLAFAAGVRSALALRS